MDLGPPNALDATVERYEQPLMRCALRIVSDRERASDVVQDTFLRLVESDVDIDDPRIGSWLFTVCRNRAIDVKRRRAKLAVVASQPEVPVAARADEDRAVAEVFDAIDAMPERPAQVMQLRYREGQSYRHIAEKTGMSVSHVGVTIHKAIRQLRTQLAVAVVIALLVGVVWQQLRGRQVAVLENIDVPTVETEPAAIDLQSEWPAMQSKRVPQRVVIVPEAQTSGRAPAKAGVPQGGPGGGGRGGLAAPKRAAYPAAMGF